MHKVGVIGLGDFGSFALKAIELLDDFEVYAVSDIVPIVKPEQAVFYRNYHDLLDDNKVDIVYIATENYNHVVMAIEALEKGKAVLCEKPLFISLSEMEQIKSAVIKYNRPFKVNFVLPNSVLYKKAINIIKNKELGQLLFIQIENYATESRTGKDWYHSDSKSGGWFATSDIHFFHIIYFFGEESLEIHDVKKEFSNKKTISTYCYLNFGDVPISIYHHLNSKGREKFQMKLIFQNGELIIFGWVPTKLIKKNALLIETFKEIVSEEDVYHRLIAENFKSLFDDKDKLEEDFIKTLGANILALEANEPINRYRMF